jgi:putative (di)nucleoside polyphosphate hydrolase
VPGPSFCEAAINDTAAIHRPRIASSRLLAAWYVPPRGTNPRQHVLPDVIHSEEIFMPALAIGSLQNKNATSCGTLIINSHGKILLCHVTGTNHWDIPKGMKEPEESAIDAARRELQEETGLEFDESLFEEIGDFDYEKNKRLHLYKLRVPESLDSLDRLICTSHFLHDLTGELTPEMDDFCWAAREDIRKLCTLRMAERLLSLAW